MPRNCGGCKYYRPGERVEAIWPNGEIRMDPERGPIIPDGGACVANPEILPMPRAWFYTKSGYLNTIGTTQRSGKTCPRWDGGARDLSTLELERQAIIALERAADEEKLSVSALVMQMLESRQRKLRLINRKKKPGKQAQ